MGRNPGQPAGNSITVMYVWNNPYCGFFFPAWDAARLACSLYDEQCSAEPTAHFLQYRPWFNCLGSQTCAICGMAAGLLVHICYGKKSFFNFTGFEPRASRDVDPNPFLRFLKNLGRNIKATGGYFLLGVLLSALFQRYVPAENFAELFGKSNEGFGVLMAATIGVPLYACGGGTIPLLQQWLVSGMSMGSAAAFMITGPATKITNLGALKIVLGVRRFIIYIVFVMLFSLMTGLLTNLVV